MKKAVKVIIATLVFILTSIPAIVMATPSDTDQLIALGMHPAIAKKLISVVNTLASPFTNNTWITVRNAANLANIDVLKVDATDDTVLNADSGDIIKLSIAGTNEAYLVDDSLKFAVITAGSPILGTSSVDAADDNTLSLASAGAAGDTRGGFVNLLGNEVASVGGSIDLTAGNAATATVDVNLEHASSTFNVKDTTSGTVLTVTDAGAVTSAAGITATTGNVTSTAGSFVASASGQTLALQEATAGAKCMGTATANGTTAVTVSTTCALTASRIFISATSDGSGAAANDQVGCWTTNIVNATSFDLDCSDANNNATYNWIIFQEAA